MSSFEVSVVVEIFQVFANGDLRSAKVFSKIAHQDAAIRAQQFEDFATTFCTQHRKMSPTFRSRLRQHFHANLFL